MWMKFGFSVNGLMNDGQLGFRAQFRVFPLPAATASTEGLPARVKGAH